MREISGTELTTISLKFLEQFRANRERRHILWITYLWLARKSALDHREGETGSRSHKVPTIALRTQRWQSALSRYCPWTPARGALFLHPMLQGAHSGPLPAMSSPQGQVDIYPHPTISFQTVLCTPGTVAVLLLCLYQSTIAHNTFSVILRVILTTVTLAVFHCRQLLGKFLCLKDRADSCFLG